MASAPSMAASSSAAAPLTGHDWRWVCSCLASPRFPAPRLPMVDTILITGGRPSLWLALQSDGSLQPKPITSASSQDIYNAFCAYSLGYPRNLAAEQACVAHYAVGLPQVRAPPPLQPRPHA